MRIALLLGLCLAPSSSAAGAASNDPLDNWHQWRGPLATGLAPRGDPPTRWDRTSNIKWKTTIPGRGSATPVVWGDLVFVLSAVDTGRSAGAADLPKVEPGFEKKTKAPSTYHRFLVIAVDRASGRIRWQRTATERVPHEGHHPTHSYAAASPTTDGRFIYASFGSRGVYCYDVAGQLRWHRDLGRMQTRLGWGEGTSPVLKGDTLIVNWDHEAGSALIALDARTGQTRWKVSRDEPTSWATPLVVEHQGRTQVVVSGTNRVRSYDLATGAVLWQCGGQTVNAIPSPVTGAGLAFCMSGYRGAAAYAIPLDATGDLTGTNRIPWHYDRGTPYVPSPLLAGRRLYFTQGNNALLTCLDIGTGKPIIDRERLPGLSSLYASPAAAAGRLYFVGRDGTTLVLRQADKVEVLATNRLDEPIDASPVIVGRQLFLRGEETLYCIEEKEAAHSSLGLRRRGSGVLGGFLFLFP
jgi:outer membrane protein assembly factor BamB